MGMDARAERGTAEDPYEYVIMIPEPTTGLSRRELVDSTAAWGDQLRESGLGTYRGSFFDTLAQVDAFMRKRRAEGKPPIFAVIDSMVALRMAKAWGVTPIICPVYEGKITFARFLVAARSHPAKSIEDLRGQRISVVKMFAEAPDLLGLSLFGEPVKPGAFSQIRR